MHLECVERRTLWEDRWYPRGIFFRDGSAFVTLSGTATGSSGGAYLSRDAGRTWTPSPLQDATELSELPDGSVLGFGCTNAVLDKLRRDQPFQPFIARVRRGRSAAALLAGDYEDDFVPVRVPELTGGYGDADNYGTGALWGGAVQRPDGALLLSMYGQFRGDRIKVPYFKSTFQYRSWTALSRDGGLTWRYLSTLASPAEHPLPALSEGYCEPDMLDLGGGEILAVLRTGGNPAPGGSRERYTPLVTVRSRDAGASWSAPRPIAPYGVAPRLLLLRDGTVACLTGRPGFFLLLSADRGETWSAPLPVTENEGAWQKSPSGYGTVAETEPGILTVLYDDYVPADGGNRLETRLARFRR